MARAIDDYESLQKEIGRRLQVVRVELGFTQVELAKQCGVSNARISENEMGNTLIGTDLVLTLWKTFTISPFYLLFGIGPRRFGSENVGAESGLSALQELLKSVDRTREWLLVNGGEIVPQPEPEDMYRFTNARVQNRIDKKEYSAKEVAELLNELRKKSKNNS